MSQDTGKFRKNTKDQFYTKPAIAAACVARILEILPNPTSHLWIEPAAGAGAFLSHVPSGTPLLALDIDPKTPSATQSDFLNWLPPTSTQPILVFGNPPFGKQGSTAKAFIKHATTFATAIAFILPRSFEKPSMSRAFPPNFHCTYSDPLPPNSFEVNGEPYDVPCVFQIWQRKAEPRPTTTQIQPVGFTYVKATDNFDIAFRRVGVNAGKCWPKGAKEFSPQSHYFWRLDEQFQPLREKIVTAINQHTFPSNTTGPRSISKHEANAVINPILAQTLAAQPQ